MVTKVRAVGLRSISIRLHGEDRFEPTAIDETASHSATAGKEVDKRVPAEGHGMKTKSSAGGKTRQSWPPQAGLAGTLQNLPEG